MVPRGASHAVVTVFEKNPDEIKSGLTGLDRLESVSNNGVLNLKARPFLGFKPFPGTFDMC